MITPQAKQHGTTFHGVFHLPCNVCARCGGEDDPQPAASWKRDEDDDRVCPACTVHVCHYCDVPLLLPADYRYLDGPRQDEAVEGALERDGWILTVNGSRAHGECEG